MAYPSPTLTPPPSMDDDWDEKLLRASIRKSLQQTGKQKLAALMPKLRAGGRIQVNDAIHDADDTHVNLERYLDLKQWPCHQAGKSIAVGSDCSGLDSVMAAFHHLQLGKRVKLLFRYDKDEAC